MILAVISQVDSGSSSLSVKDITQGLIFVNTTVAGLVSALVIAELAVTQPGQTPGARILAEGIATKRKKISNTIAAFYVSIWMLAGLAALIFGVILYPGVSSTLSDAGTTWLGLAVAAGYSYFGIQPTT